MVSRMEERRQGKKDNTEGDRKKYRRLNNERLLKAILMLDDIKADESYGKYHHWCSALSRF